MTKFKFFGNMMAESSIPPSDIVLLGHNFFFNLKHFIFLIFLNVVNTLHFLKINITVLLHDPYMIYFHHNV